ncbi:unnamed protein product [Albugo candida]|uniref:AB hydrolase-1 domain-containing protein n=1 Tax=Albugo candida TaxID=65357 RepID=A0A024G991_9STRA|nr:unnamed protein product [Albugo candida]|eukprot:CCI43249.1 unnamed protein product [Albugo candida]
MQRSSNAKWRSSKTRIFLLLCLSPFLLIALFIWWALGRLLTLSSWIVGATFITLSWVLYFLQLPSQALLLVDLPITITVIMLAWIFLLPQHLLHVTRNTGYKFLIRASVWMVLLAYSLARRWTVANPSDQTVAILNVYVFLTSIFPLWHLITDLRLWVPANEIDLEIAERNIYEQHIQSEYRVKTVAGLGTVHVPYCGDDNSNPSCLVLLHGYLAGNAFWAASLQELAKSYDLYAVEWKGVGRSVRARYRPKNHDEADNFFVESLEEWRKTLEMDRFILCGHSMGGIYATHYAAKYGRHIEQLLLVSPAGVNPSTYVGNKKFPLLYRVAKMLHLTPMWIIRFVGPFGQRLTRAAMRRRISLTATTNVIRCGDMNFDDITSYSYHNWALKASTDIAIYTHLHPDMNAHHGPICDSFGHKKIKIPVIFIYGGGDDWMNPSFGEQLVQRLEKTQYAKFHLVPYAGHQVFMDNPKDFNRIVIDSIQECRNTLTQNA